MANELQPKIIFATVKAAEAGAKDHDIVVVCSTDAVDRSDEIIHQDGWVLDNFVKNPVFLAAHQHRLADGRSSVIGSFRDIAVVAGKLTGKVAFANTDLGREYKSLYADGHMRAVSVGFMPLEGGKRKSGGRETYHHTKQELYEVSAVAVPCNQEALTTMGLGGAAEKAIKQLTEAMTAKLDELGLRIEQGLEEIKASLPDSVHDRSGEQHGSCRHGRDDDAGDTPPDEGKGSKADEKLQSAAEGLLASCRI